MHKSGTTLVSQILHHSDINMGDEEIDTQQSYDDGNKYERESTKTVNHSLLGSKGKYSLDIVPPASALELSAVCRAEIHQLVEDCNAAHEDWGFKDPRTYLTYPIWEKELPDHKLVIVFRQPEEMWQRYRPANPLVVFYRAFQLMKRWNECYGRLFAYLGSASAESIVIDYSKLMTEDTEFLRLQSFVGRDLKDSRQPSLYRGRLQSYRALRFARYWLRVTGGLDSDEITSRFDAIIARQTRRAAGYRG